MREICMLRAMWRGLETGRRDGLRHRHKAKAAGKRRLPGPTAAAPVFDPTERGAYGNVNYGGTRNPLHTPKGCRTETLCLRLRAPYFYPTSRACLQRGNSGTWESPLSP